MNQEIMTWAEVGRLTDWATRVPQIFLFYSLVSSRPCSKCFYSPLSLWCLAFTWYFISHKVFLFANWIKKKFLCGKFIFPWEDLAAILSEQEIHLYLFLTTNMVWTEPCAASCDRLVTFEPQLHFFLMLIYLFWERQSARVGWGRERDRHRIWSRLQALNCQPKARCGAWTHRC